MSRKADAEKQEEEQAAAAIDGIERKAKERYEADQRAAAEQAGKWEWVEASGYYYNAKHRWVLSGCVVVVHLWHTTLAHRPPSHAPATQHTQMVLRPQHRLLLWWRAHRVDQEAWAAVCRALWRGATRGRQRAAAGCCSGSRWWWWWCGRRRQQQGGSGSSGGCGRQRPERRCEKDGDAAAVAPAGVDWWPPDAHCRADRRGQGGGLQRADNRCSSSSRMRRTQGEEERACLQGGRVTARRETSEGWKLRVVLHVPCFTCCRLHVASHSTRQPQRKRDAPTAAGGAGSKKKPVDPAEAEALARREAARRRVEDRTKAAFGLT
jgi:hypothetical protein